MSKKSSSGQLLLARLANTYRANPKFWSGPGWGRMPNGDGIDGLEPTQKELALMASCCIDAGLMKLGPECGGQQAIDEARFLLYKKLGAPNREVIWHYNDAEGRVVEQIIDLLDSAATLTLFSNDALSQLLGIAESSQQGQVAKQLELA